MHIGDAKEFHSDQRFDLIISNPPFFIHQLKSPNTRTNAALHGSELKPEDLCTIVNRLSTEDGKFFVLLPEQEMILLRRQLEASGWWSIYELSIYQEAHKTIFRQVGGFSKKDGIPFVRQQLVIYKKGKTYTEEFIELLKDYYLYL